MRYLKFLFALFLSACGGGHKDEPYYPDIPDGIPVIVGGFIGWENVQPTPDSTIGIVNGTGNAMVSVTFTDASGSETFLTNIAPGALWASGYEPLPGFYLVSALGADGRIFKRYGQYDPATGWEAFVISNANWSLDL